MRIILATILTAAIATPAAAQYASPTGTTGDRALRRPVVTETKIVTVRRIRPGASAYAQSPAMERHSLNPETDVYVNGVYVGSDPDPRIRETLRREFLSESSIH